MDINFLVRVSCMTFNHAPYIEDAMNGFCMQETNFPFVCTIMDDASTDGEPEVIKKYLQGHFNLDDKSIVRNEDTDDYEMTFAQHKTNKNCYFAVYLLKYNHYKKKSKDNYMKEWMDTDYVAMCEGDDYWIYPNKLQMQIDFLSSHSDFSVCFHNAIITYDDKSMPANIFNSIEKNREVQLEELIKDWIVPTASMVFISSYGKLFSVKEPIVSSDWRRLLHLAGLGRVYAFKNVMSVYRKTYYSDSSTSKNKDNGAFMCHQKHHILESFDVSTDYKYHHVINKYSKYWKDYEMFTIYKKKSKLLAILRMPKFAMKRLILRNR